MADTTPVMVVGAPRSGTTLVGNYIGSARSVYNLGEFNGFYLALELAQQLQARAVRNYIDRYVDALFDHARSFVTAETCAAGAAADCDSSPLNLLIVSQLALRIPEAIFVLVIRSPIGVIQSLGRCYRDGASWAGATVEDRAVVYARFYRHCVDLPVDRTVVVSYDALCARPAPVLACLDNALATFNPALAGYDRSVFAYSHANPTGAARRTLGRLRAEGAVELVPMPSHDAVSWDEDTAKGAAAVVCDATNALRKWLCSAGAGLAPQR